MNETTQRGRVQLSDGGHLCYERSGPAETGTPILLLRPLGGSMALWGPFAAGLVKEREVVAFDPRGVGDSSGPRWLQTTRDMARDACALAEALGINRFHVFGLSLGGMVASWLAIDHPVLVAKLVLASTLPRPSKVSHRVRHEVVPLARALLRPGSAAEVALVHEILSSEFRRAHPERVRAIEALVRAHPSGRRNLLALGLAAARHDVGDLLGGIASPTLVLVGELDPIVGKRADAELLQNIPNATLCVVGNCGHDLTLEQPEITAERVKSFLTK